LTGLKLRYDEPYWRSVLEWYSSRPRGSRDYKLKAAVSAYIHAVAEANRFKVFCRPIVTYMGHAKARMIHFAFEMEADSENLWGFSKQNQMHVMDLPMLRSDSGKLALARIQHRQYSVPELTSILDFLSDQVTASLIAHYDDLEGAP
ncbi:MAG: hypothetical protein ACYDCQ_21225, partial [Dehalococcoidia bacterium]